METSSSALALDRHLFIQSAPGGLRLGFLLSAAAHCYLLGFIAMGARPASALRRPIYESIIRPNEKKIIWYRKFPDIVPTVKVSNLENPRGKVKSDAIKIAMLSQPSSSQQLILQPAPQIKLEHDLAAPNLIELAAPIQRPEPKRTRPFVAPPPIRAPEPSLPEPVLLERPPDVHPETPAELAGLPGPVFKSKLPAKPFAPPTARRSLDAGAQGSTLETAPNLPAGSNLNLAVIGLNPVDRLDFPIPPGTRPAEFSAAPAVGDTATGDVNGAGGLAVPGLLIKEGKVGKEGKEGKDNRANPNGSPPPVRSRTVLYGDMVSKSLLPSLSAPLRPASRTIPRALEGRFQGRLVYVVIIPAPALPAYTGDWILWFAERAPTSGEVPLMRAPLPFRKLEPLENDEISDSSEARIQLSAFLKVNGQFDSVVVVKGPDSPASLSAIADLKRWEFRPATRDGSPVDVEIVIEIPFRLAWLKGAQ